MTSMKSLKIEEKQFRAEILRDKKSRSNRYSRTYKNNTKPAMRKLLDAIAKG